MAMGEFATNLLTVSLAMMGFRGGSAQSVFIGNLVLVAGIGMTVLAQWALAKDDTFAHIVYALVHIYAACRRADVARIGLVKGLNHEET